MLFRGFQKAALKALDSANVILGTITFGGDDFILGIKKRHDIEIHEVTPENRDSLPEMILEKIMELLKKGSEEE